MKEARAGHAVSIVGLKDYDAWCNLRGTLGLYLTRIQTLFLEGMVSIKNDKQLGSGPLPLWGPDYTIKLEININSFGDPEIVDEYSDVLHFTATDKTCCDAGDRVPGVFLNNHAKRILVAMWGNWPTSSGIGNIYYTSGILDEKRWYDLEIKQENVRYLVLKSTILFMPF